MYVRIQFTYKRTFIRTYTPEKKQFNGQTNTSILFCVCACVRVCVLAAQLIINTFSPQPQFEANGFYFPFFLFREVTPGAATAAATAAAAVAATAAAAAGGSGSWALAPPPAAAAAAPLLTPVQNFVSSDS